MKPLKLVMQAFGPFAGREEVDFRPALAAGLFGIYGPTGAGKSTLFNAITFALFGRTAREGQDPAHLRSGHAASHVLTEVSFVFDLGDRRWHVRRVPAQQRPKQRGEGFTPMEHAAWLFDATGMAPEEITSDNPGHPVVERKVQDVATAMTDILGYGAEQFRRIVLLPQGQFERFLHVNTRERLEILRELFDVSLYRHLAEELRARAEELQQRVNAMREIFAQRLRTEGFDDMEALARGIAEAERHRDELAKVEERRREDWEKARDALQEGRQLAGRFVILEELREHLATLEARRGEMERRRARLERAERARAARDLHAQARTAARDVSVAGGELEKLRATHAAAARKMEESNRSFNLLEKRLESLRQQLQEAREKVRLRVELQGRRLRLEAELKAAGEHEVVSGAVRDAEKALRRHEQAHTRARERCEEARRALASAEDALAHAQALHLARRLRPGEPCPVCGARAHPAPATGEPGKKGLDAAFRAARDGLDKAREEEADAARELAAAESRLRERQRRLASIDAPRRGREELERELKELEREIGALPDDAALKELERRWSGEERALGKAREARQEARAALAALEASLEAARESLRRARERHEAAREDFARRLAEQGLSERDYDELAPLCDALDEEREEVEGFFERLGLAAARLRETKEELAGARPPDMPLLQRAEREAGEALRRATRDVARARARLERLQALHRDLEDTRRRARELEAEAGPVMRLGEELSGRNPLKLDLETFAIGALFDRVLHAANRRLAPMSRGRFHLLRQARGSRRGLRGLGLDVFDAHTGQERPVHTLSGGETFMAALSLALGLADVVEGMGGKVRLDTIFIDEGFGALDSDEESGTLEQVLEVLRALADTRRVVGVISHVERVKEAIPEGFEIIPSPGGSTIRTRSCDL